jgi:two-component system cell cycle response regulator DivK
MANELILVVEDNEKNRKLLRAILTARGYEVVEVVNAEDGLVLARQRHPALVLMDIQLPGMDGIEARQILGDDPATSGIPVLAVTASVMPSDRQKILASGFEGYITKPIEVDEFLAEVRSVLDAHAAVEK